jgi:hypothetical protein
MNEFAIGAAPAGAIVSVSLITLYGAPQLIWYGITHGAAPCAGYVTV